MFLKIGSRGKDVELLQQFLKVIPVTGYYGTITDTAVRQWQASHGLTVDGQVGRETWTSMGIISTDQTERKIQKPPRTRDLLQYEFEDLNGLRVIKHFLPVDEYIPARHTKNTLAGHHTSGWHDPIQTADGWDRDTRGPVATPFIIGGRSITGQDDFWDGQIVHVFPTDMWAHHLSVGLIPIHWSSVGVEICNFAWIENGRTYKGQLVDPSQIIRLSQKFRGHQDWHAYSDKQIKAYYDLIHYISSIYDIDPRKGLRELIDRPGDKVKLAHEAFDFCNVKYCQDHPGYWNHANVCSQKSDLSPQPRLIEMIMSL